MGLVAVQPRWLSGLPEDGLSHRRVVAVLGWRPASETARPQPRHHQHRPPRHRQQRDRQHRPPTSIADELSQHRLQMRRESKARSGRPARAADPKAHLQLANTRSGASVSSRPALLRAPYFCTLWKEPSPAGPSPLVLFVRGGKRGQRWWLLSLLEAQRSPLLRFRVERAATDSRILLGSRCHRSMRVARSNMLAISFA